MSNQHYTLHYLEESPLRQRLKLRNVASAKYGGDWLSIPHAHNYTELFYIIGGDGMFQIDDDMFPVSADQLIVVNPNVIHTEVGYDSRPLEYIVIGVEGLEVRSPEGQDGRFSVFAFSGPDEILFCMQNILRELQNRGLEYETACQAYMEILVIRLNRKAEFSFNPVPEKPAASRQCASIRHYIESHYKEKLTLDLLAEEANVNKYYLAHAFKQEFGISPINYMNLCRINEGKRLLTETDLTLIQISGMLGFSSGSYFSQAFRRGEGISPLEYRKSMKR